MTAITTIINRYITGKIIIISDGENKNWLNDRLRNLSAVKRQLYEGVRDNKIDVDTYKKFSEYLSQKGNRSSKEKNFY